MARRLLFVTGPGCGLCERAWRSLGPLRRLGRFDVVDATEDTEWLERIPVVLAPDRRVIWEQGDGGTPRRAVARYLLTGK